MKKVEFQVFNGTYQIVGTKYLPNESNHTPIVMSHGFLSNQKHLKKYAECLCNLGYTVYTYDFCGGHLFGKSEGTRNYMTLSHELKDMETVITNIEEDKTNLILFGESQGGFLSLVYAGRHPDQIKNVLCIYPALCIPDDARKGKMLFMSFDPNDIDHTFKTKFGFDFNKEYAKEAFTYNLKDILQAVKCPVCIVCGDQDKIVNPNYFKTAEELLSNTSKVYFIKGAGHGFHRKEIILANQYFQIFLKERATM